MTGAAPARRLVSRAAQRQVSSHPRSPRGPALGPLGVAAAFTLFAVVTLGIAVAGARWGRQPATGNSIGWLQAWVRYDAGWYRSIAESGYFFRPGEQSSVAFFPAYPLLMRAGGGLADVYLVGVLVTLLAGLASAMLFARWCADRMRRPAAATAVALLLVYPYSLYLYGAVYADALFLACALGSFVLLERGHPWLAGLVGAVATAGRPVGIAVAAGLVVRAVELAGQRAGAGRATPVPGAGWRQRLAGLNSSSWQHLRSVRLGDAGVLLSFGGLAGYMAYLWVAFGDPVAFATTQSAPGWDQGTGVRVWLKVDFFGRMVYGTPPERVRLLVPALLCLLALLLLRRIGRRFGWGYATLTAVAVAIPVLGTKDFMGSGRYLLAAFPMFAAAGELLSERASRGVRIAVLGLSAVLLAVATAGYGYGYEVS